MGHEIKSSRQVKSDCRTTIPLLTWVLFEVPHWDRSTTRLARRLLHVSNNQTGRLQLHAALLHDVHGSNILTNTFLTRVWWKEGIIKSSAPINVTRAVSLDKARAIQRSDLLDSKRNVCTHSNVGTNCRGVVMLAAEPERKTKKPGYFEVIFLQLHN